MIESGSRRSVGAWGLRFEGFDDPALLVDVPSTWTPIEVEAIKADCADDAPIDVGADSASMGMSGIGEVRVHREPARVLVRSRRAVDADIMIHPVLGWAAWVMACWSGRSVLHAGAFVGKNGAWVALGERGAGKSTLMAALAQRGIAVLADDIAVIDKDCVLAGPRRLDLRPDAPEGLDLETTRWIRGGNRLGAPLGPVDSSYPLAGFLRLGWGDEVSVAPVPALDRIGALHELVGSTTSNPTSVLDIVSFPMIGLVRPQSWAAMDASVEAVIAAAE